MAPFTVRSRQTALELSLCRATTKLPYKPMTLGGSTFTRAGQLDALH